jgi:type VI secretion system secreted protein VgrG
MTSHRESAPIAAGDYVGRYQLFKDDNRPFAGYKYRIEDKSGNALKEGVTDQDGFTDYVATDTPTETRVYKYVTRESERITEDWESGLDTEIARAAAEKTEGEE